MGLMNLPAGVPGARASFLNPGASHQEKGMPSKHQHLLSALQRIIKDSGLNLEDQTLLLEFAKTQPVELYKIVQRESFRRRRIRYWKTSNHEELQKLLVEDADRIREREEVIVSRQEKLKLRRQARVLEAIAEWFCVHRDEIATIDKRLAGSMEDQKSVGIMIDGLVMLCMRAARNGLLNHPYISKMVMMQRLTYNKKLLRKAKIGLETHLVKPIEARQLEIDEMKKRGRSLRTIVSILKARDLNPAGRTLGKSAIGNRLAKHSHNK